MEFEVAMEYDGERLDKYLALIYQQQSRSFFQRLIKDQLVLVNGRPAKASYPVSGGDLLHVTVPKAQ